MLDGVGVAAANALNPLCTAKTPILGHFGLENPPAKPLHLSQQTKLEFNHGVVLQMDACLGVPGLPQSGTGQTSLLTGQNAAQLMGRHYGPWPGPSLQPLLEQSLPVRLAKMGKTVRLANHYPARYLEAVQRGKLRLNAIAKAATLAGASLEANADDGRIPPPFGQPDEVAATSLEQVKRWGRGFVQSNADLTIFDSWWSDKLGHLGAPEPSQAREAALAKALEHAERLEVFIAAALEYRPEDLLFLLTSDHGNFEDMGVKTHTFNPVPLVAIGPHANEFAAVHDLTGVAPALEQAFGI